jgi:hypothetical protein
VALRTVVGEVVDDPRLTPGIARPEHLAPYADGARFDTVLSRMYAAAIAAAPGVQPGGGTD